MERKLLKEEKEPENRALNSLSSTSLCSMSPNTPVTNANSC